MNKHHARQKFMFLSHTQIIYLKNKWRCNQIILACTKAIQTIKTKSISLKRNEKDIIKGCIKGDKASQYALYEMFKRDVMGICMRYSRDRSEAEDMMQEGFIKVYSDLYQYRPIGPLGGWIRRVVVNSCLRFIRKRKRLVFNEFSGMKTELIPTNENVVSDLGAQDLMKLVQKLPDGYRLVFNLYVVEGFSHQEIADQLGISVNTSKSQLSRAKANLRKTIEKILI